MRTPTNKAASADCVRAAYRCCHAGRNRPSLISFYLVLWEVRMDMRKSGRTEAGVMEGLWASFGIGFVAGLRSMTATAALTWAASLGRTRGEWIPAGTKTRDLAMLAALAEMAGDKMPFAPDRRIPP